jgi:hypothetical protein
MTIQPIKPVKPKQKQRPLLAALLLIFAIAILAVGIAYYNSTIKSASDALGQAGKSLDAYYGNVTSTP